MVRTAITAVILASPVALAMSNIDPARPFGWGENIGWTNWRDANGGADAVRVDRTFLSGFIWGENVGWINTGDGSPADGVSYANADGTDFGVNVDPGTGDLYGLAWGENIGWVNFDTRASLTPHGQQARLDCLNDRLAGYAWGENVGWINLDDATHYVGLLPGPDVTEWSSVQHHGPAGPNAELGIPLIAGADTVECRFAQTQHLIRVEIFSPGEAPAVAGTVQAIDQNTAATFDAAANLIDNGGGSYTLDLVFNPPLPSAANAPETRGCYLIDLPMNAGCPTGDPDMRFKVVIGDVSEDGQTLLNDFALTKLRAQVVPFAVDPGNLGDIRRDISNDGQIVLNDVALVKLNQFNGRILACP